MALSRRMLALSSVALVACGKPEFTHEGAHIRFAAEASGELCAGTIAHMDRFIELLSAEFQLEPPTGTRRIEYFWSDFEDFRALAPCPPGVAGCASARTVFSWTVPHTHELVHAVASRLSHPAPFFTEGLAEAYQGLDGSSLEFGSEWRPGYVREALDAKRYTGISYAGAGAFVSHLIATHGIDKYLRVYAEIPRRAELADIDAAFRAVFGVSLEDSLVDYELDGARCGPRGYTARLAECDAPELEWDDDRLVFWRDLACDEPDAIGPYDGGSVQVLHTLVIPEVGDYHVALVSDDPTATHRLSLDACTRCTGPELTLDAGERVVATLSPGRHALRLRGPVGLPTRVGVLLERVDLEDAP